MFLFIIFITSSAAQELFKNRLGQSHKKRTRRQSPLQQIQRQAVVKKQCQSFLQIMANACPIFSILTKTCAQQNCLCTYRISLSSAMLCRLGVSHVQVRGFQFQILSMAHKALFCFKYASAIFFCIITKAFKLFSKSCKICVEVGFFFSIISMRFWDIPCSCSITWTLQLSTFHCLLFGMTKSLAQIKNY